jgi:hypothetical protein
MTKPNVNSESAKELDKAEKHFDAYKEHLDTLTVDRMNQAPLKEVEEQTKISQQDLAKSTDIYLKPKVSISSQEKFNERWREDYNFQKEYVHFTAENVEIIGEEIGIWTKPFPGMPAQEWKVPVNTPVWGPRFLAEQINRANYHVFIMKKGVSVGSDSMGEYQGAMAVDCVKQRLKATPVVKKRSVFMSVSGF